MYSGVQKKSQGLFSHTESICFHKPTFIILTISFQNGGVVQTYVDGCCKTCKYSSGMVASCGLWRLLYADWMTKVAVVGFRFWLLVLLGG